MNLYDKYNESKKELLDYALSIDRDQVRIEKQVSESFGLLEFRTGYTYLRHKLALEDEMKTLSLDQIDIVEKEWKPFLTKYPALHFESVIDRTTICIIPLEALTDKYRWLTKFKLDAQLYFKQDEQEHLQNEFGNNK